LQPAHCVPRSARTRSRCPCQADAWCGVSPVAA
jgi:hypothetical protein